MEFGPLSEEFFDDPYPAYRWLRDQAPCYRNEEHGLRLDQLTDPENRAAKQNIIFMDPPDREWMRKLVSRAFTPRAIARWSRSPGP